MTQETGKKVVSFEHGVTLIGELDETVLDRKEVYRKIIKGEAIPEKQMFSRIQYCSPLGILRTMPHTPVNVARYNNYVKKRHREAKLYEQHCAEVSKLMEFIKAR